MAGLMAWGGLALLAGGLVLVVILMVRGPMRGLLTANATIAPASGFYVRAFVLVMVLAALAAVAGTNMPCQQQAENTMTLVWWSVGRLEPVCWSVSGFLMGFVLLLTILFAVLGRYRDQ